MLPVRPAEHRVVDGELVSAAGAAHVSFSMSDQLTTESCSKIIGGSYIKRAVLNRADDNSVVGDGE